MTNSQACEATKSDFDPILMKAARDKSERAMSAIAAKIKSGITEEEAIEIAKSTISEMGAEKNWHRPIVRFGKNTLLNYGGKSEAGVVLKENDIYFLDIGPVWEGYEGDIGKTYAVGSDEDMSRCAADAEKIFQTTAAHWQNKKATGQALYDFAEHQARECGWIFVRENADGHRVADFPHHAYYKGNVADLDFTPAAGLWILEIQIRHPEREFGAFYEDLLG